MRHLIFGAIAALGLIWAGAPQAQHFISVGTGSVTGVYYPAGGAICRLVNADRKVHGVRCAVEATGGSVYNINNMQDGEFEFGVVQSDWQHHAYNGTSAFADNPFPGLRSVFAVHPEPFTLVVRKDSGIRNFNDLRGKRVNVGNPGSGQRATMEEVMAAFGITMDDFAAATEYKGSDMTRHFCDGSIDAMIYTIGHPAAAIKETLGTCGANLVSVNGSPVDQLIQKNPYYRKASIPASMYGDTGPDVETFGVGATLVTSDQVPDDVVYAVAKSVLANLEALRALHPVFANLQAREMVADGLSAPLHPGAERAYIELGLK